MCLSAGRECHPNPTKMLISLVTQGRDKYTKGSLFVWSDGVKIRRKDKKTMGLTGSGINSLIMIQMACLIHADCVMRPNSTGNVRNRWNCPWPSLNKLRGTRVGSSVSLHLPPTFISHSFQSVLLAAFFILTFFLELPSSLDNTHPNWDSARTVSPTVTVLPLLWQEKCFPSSFLLPRSFFIYLSTSHLLFHRTLFMSRESSGSIFFPIENRLFHIFAHDLGMFSALNWICAKTMSHHII